MPETTRTMRTALHRIIADYDRITAGAADLASALLPAIEDAREYADASEDEPNEFTGEPANHSRAERVAQLFDVYHAEHGERGFPATTVPDMIADLLHLATVRGYLEREDHDVIMRRAVNNFETEIAQEADAEKEQREQEDDPRAASPAQRANSTRARKTRETGGRS